MNSRTLITAKETPMIKLTYKDQDDQLKESKMITLNIQDANLLIKAIYNADVENIDVDAIADRQDLVQFFAELEALVKSSSGQLTLMAYTV